LQKSVDAEVDVDKSTGDDSKSRKIALGVIAAAALALCAWYGLSGGGTAHPPTTSVVAAAAEQKTFFVGAVDADQKATDYLKAVLSGGAAAGDDGLKAENGPALRALANSSPQTAKEIESGERRLYRVTLLDFLNQDGDHVELTVDGVSYGDLNLSNAGASFLIPLAPGKPVDMKLTATADGGGGVTVGFISSVGEARTDVMQVGQSAQWQVILQ
jgi:hypothetical protein